MSVSISFGDQIDYGEQEENKGKLGTRDGLTRDFFSLSAYNNLAFYHVASWFVYLFVYTYSLLAFPIKQGKTLSPGASCLTWIDEIDQTWCSLQSWELWTEENMPSFKGIQIKYFKNTKRDPMKVKQGIMRHTVFFCFLISFKYCPFINLEGCALSKISGWVNSWWYYQIQQQSLPNSHKLRPFFFSMSFFPQIISEFI